MSLAPSSSVAPLPALGPAPANHLWAGPNDWVHIDSPYARSSTSVATGFYPVAPDPPLTVGPRLGVPLPRAAPAPLPQRSVGGGIASVGCALDRTETGLGYAPSDATLSADVVEAIAMHQIRTLRAHLQVQQDRLYDGPARSHSDMALADAEFNELEVKIKALEACMTAFGAWFRTG